MLKNSEPADIKLHQLAQVLYHSREWHADLQREFEIHAAVVAAFKIAQCCDWHKLVLEWPHRSKDDPKQIAYVRSLDKAAANKNTKTSVGKYLKRHFPTLKDDVIRDLAYRFNTTDCSILRTSEEIVEAIQNGPYSCMQLSGRSFNDHPYRAYAPDKGWGLAIRKGEAGAILGRALVYESDDDKCFVRTYDNGQEFSESDHGLESWLKAQGYEFARYWPDGAELARVTTYRGSVLFPYLDGGTQNVRDDGDCLVIDEDGNYNCTNTDGTASSNEEEEDEDSTSCDDCGDSVHNDEIQYISYDNSVCEACCSRNYTYIYSSNSNTGDGYYVRDRQVVEIDGDNYDEDDLPNYIVTLANGDYCHEDGAIYCEESEAYYHDDDDIVYAEGRHGQTVCHKDYAFQCFKDGKWYISSQVESVEFEGKTYHPDNVPEEGEDEDEGQGELGGYVKPDGSVSNDNQLSLGIVETGYERRIELDQFLFTAWVADSRRGYSLNDWIETIARYSSKTSHEACEWLKLREIEQETA